MRSPAQTQLDEFHGLARYLEGCNLTPQLAAAVVEAKRAVAEVEPELKADDLGFGPLALIPWLILGAAGYVLWSVRSTVEEETKNVVETTSTVIRVGTWFGLGLLVWKAAKWQ